MNCFKSRTACVLLQYSFSVISLALIFGSRDSYTSWFYLFYPCLLFTISILAFAHLLLDLLFSASFKTWLLHHYCIMFIDFHSKGFKWVFNHSWLFSEPYGQHCCFLARKSTMTLLWMGQSRKKLKHKQLDKEFPVNYIKRLICLYKLRIYKLRKKKGYQISVVQWGTLKATMRLINGISQVVLI